jgi:hypothetical protein
MQTVELLGRLLEALGERGDELFSLGQLGLESFDSFLAEFCFDHPDATVARFVPVRPISAVGATGRPVPMIFRRRTRRTAHRRLSKKGNKIA